MADTIGSLVDKLATVNNKMFFNQEFLYEIRRMTVDEFICTYDSNYNKTNSTSALENLYIRLQKVVDLNLQRQSLILEHDKMLVDMVLDLITNPENAYSKYVVDQHKTLKEENK